MTAASEAKIEEGNITYLSDRPLGKLCFEEDRRTYLADRAKLAGDDVESMMRRYSRRSRSGVKAGGKGLPAMCKDGSIRSGAAAGPRPDDALTVAASALGLDAVSAKVSALPYCFDTSEYDKASRGRSGRPCVSKSRIHLVGGYRVSCKKKKKKKKKKNLSVSSREINGEFQSACRIERDRHDFLALHPGGDVRADSGKKRKSCRLYGHLPVSHNIVNPVSGVDSIGVASAPDAGCVSEGSFISKKRRRQLPPVSLEERTLDFLMEMASSCMNTQ